MANLPTNYQDDILSGSMEGKRQYNMIQNANGTVSFEDVTDYSQEGSLFGASQMNNTNREVNKINDNNLDSLEAISANTDNGKFAGANAVKQLNSNCTKGFTSGGYSPVTGLAYDSTNKKLGLKVGATNDIIPFSSGFGYSDLLWQNPSGLTAIGKVSVTYDKSKYNAIILVYLRSTSNKTELRQVIISPNKIFGLNAVASLEVHLGSGNFAKRTISWTTTGIEISADSSSNDYNVPYRIYGINISQEYLT